MARERIRRRFVRHPKTKLILALLITAAWTLVEDRLVGWANKLLDSHLGPVVAPVVTPLRNFFEWSVAHPYLSIFVILVVYCSTIVTYAIWPSSLLRLRKQTPAIQKLRVWVQNMPGSYPEGTILANIEWKKEYSDSRLYLRNDDPVDYDDVDFTFSCNQTIAKVGQFTNFPGVYFIPAGMAEGGLFVGLAGKDNRSGEELPITQQHVMSNAWRIHCSRILTKTTVVIVLAVWRRTPSGGIHIEVGSYEIKGQKYQITNAENFVNPPAERGSV